MFSGTKRANNEWPSEVDHREMDEGSLVWCIPCNPFMETVFPRCQISKHTWSSGLDESEVFSQQKGDQHNIRHVIPDQCIITQLVSWCCLNPYSGQWPFTVFFSFVYFCSLNHLKGNLTFARNLITFKNFFSQLQDALCPIFLLGFLTYVLQVLVHHKCSLNSLFGQ